MTAPRPSDERNVSSSDTTNASRRGFITTALATGSALAFGGTAIAAESSSSASVTFDDQTTDGETVTTASVTLPEGGFVAVHDERLLDGKALESVVGVSDYLDASTHENVEITLFDVMGAEFEKRMLSEDQTLVAMPHLDSNGNDEYDFVSSGGKADGPYTMDGKAVVDDATVSVESKPTASVSFSEQEAEDGTAVTVSEATLSEGGFVTIHDNSVLDGDVFESVVGVSDYLDAGTHEDLSVSLFEGVPGREFEMASLQGEATLIAMPHFDTDDDGTYDFVTSQGEADGPYTKDGKPVVDDACITVPGKC
ncbi:hypothetical protein DMJ13_00220 [halophilic archaeon]|nr:hypothetical protein DMJ13_00220 [halophilic archaeon]